MANSVTLTFAGDTKSLDAATARAAKDIGGVSKALDDNAKHAQDASHKIGGLNSSVEGSVGKFRGSKDVVDGMSGSLQAMGVSIPGPIGNIAAMAGGLADLADGISTVVGPAIEKMVAKFGAQTVATEAQTLATGEATVAQEGLNLAMLASPLGLMIAAVAALVAVVVIIATKTDWFQKIWSAAWDVIKAAFSGVFNFIKQHWQLILEILAGPIGLAVRFIKGHWDTIKKDIGILISAVKTSFGQVTNIIFGPFKAAFNMIASAWNNTVGRLHFSIPSWVPGIGGKGFSVPSLPMLANGGPINGPAIVGERGPELFVPGTAGRIIPNNQLGGGGQTIVLQVQGPSDDLFAQWFRKQVRVLGGGDVQMAFGR